MKRIMRWMSFAVIGSQSLLWSACGGGDSTDTQAPAWVALELRTEGEPSLRIAHHPDVGWRAVLWESSDAYEVFQLSGLPTVEQRQTTGADQGSGGEGVDSLFGGSEGSDRTAIFSSRSASAGFSGSSGSSGAFSGSSGTSGGFSGSSGGSGSFSASSQGVALTCDASSLCDLFGSYCGLASGEGRAQCEQAITECRSEVNNIRVPANYEPLFCAVVEFIHCAYGAGFENVSEGQVRICAERLERELDGLEFEIPN